MNTCEIRVGRLMEIRSALGYRSVEDVDAMIAMMVAQTKRFRPNERYVIAADWRNVVVMSQDVAARARIMLSKSNARVERSSILTSSVSSTANLQVQRLVHEAENENRRQFTSAPAQHRWLSEILTPQESERLAEFLGCPPLLRPVP